MYAYMHISRKIVHMTSAHRNQTFQVITKINQIMNNIDNNELITVLIIEGTE
jgi:hypothetical protein